MKRQDFISFYMNSCKDFPTRVPRLPESFSKTVLNRPLLFSKIKLPKKPDLTLYCLLHPTNFPTCILRSQGSGPTLYTQP